jgi:hypothetical protein
MSIMLIIDYDDFHNFNANYGEYHSAECHYAECQFAECHYAECRGAKKRRNFVEKKMFRQKS